MVGFILTDMVKKLEMHREANETYIHIIGHSLGAHVAGFAGKFHTKARYQRITGILSLLTIIIIITYFTCIYK